MSEKILWLGTPENRILSIRNFRKFINTLPFEDAVRLTQKTWNSSPKVNKCQFEIGNVSAWPNPWELFSQQMFCSNSQLLGAYYTLLLSDHSKNHSIKLAIINDVVYGSYGAIVLDDIPLTSYNVEAIIEEADILELLGE